MLFEMAGFGGGGSRGKGGGEDAGKREWRQGRLGGKMRENENCVGRMRETLMYVLALLAGCRWLECVR